MTYEKYVEKSKAEAKQILSYVDEKLVDDYLESNYVRVVLEEHWKAANGESNTIGDCLALMF